MTRISTFLAVVLLYLLPISSPCLAESFILPQNTSVNVYFSPNGGCTEAIVNEIEKAKTEILVHAYSFTSAPIAKALLIARKRNVNVQVILDKSRRKQRYSAYKFFQNQGIPVYIDSAHAIAHNKIIIIDQETIITGSFNFTKAAEEKNAENLLIIKSKDLAKIYIENWKNHFDHSDRSESYEF